MNPDAGLWLRRIVKLGSHPTVALGIACALSVVLYAVYFLGLFSQHYPLPQLRVRDVRGHAVRWKLEGLPTLEKAIRWGYVEEDGWRRRSLPVTSIRKVEEIGEGRLHFTPGGNLWLSSSDNSTIADNGRDYVLVIPRKLPLPWLALPPLVFVGLWWRRPALRKPTLACGCSLVVIAVLMVQTEAGWQLRQSNEKFASLDGDLWGYRLPALRVIQDGEITQHSHRAFAYPLFAGLVMKWGVASFEYLTHVQQVVSMLSAWVLAGAVLIAFRWIFQMPWWAGGLAACVAHWLFVFSPSVISHEASFRPETTVMSASCFFVAIAVCMVVVWRWDRSLSRRYLVMLSALAITGAGIYFLKQSWGFAVLSPMLFAVLVPDRWSQRAASFAVALVVWLAVYVPLAQYQSRLEQRYDRDKSMLFTPRYLLLLEADIIRPALAKRAAEHPDDDFLAKLHEVFEAEFNREKIPGEFELNYAELGYQPGNISVALNEYKQLIPAEEQAELYVSLFLEGVRMQPLRYSLKVMRELAYCYSFSAEPYLLLTITPNMLFSISWEMLRPDVMETLSVLGNNGEVGRLEAAEHLIFMPPPPAAIGTLRWLGIVLPWLLIVVLLVIVVQIVAERRGRRVFGLRQYDALAARALLGFLLLPVSVVLVFAVMSSLSVTRFVSMGFPLTLFSQFCAIAYLARAIGRRPSRRAHG